MQSLQKLETAPRYKRLQNMQWQYLTAFKSVMCTFSCPTPGCTKALNLLHLGANSPCLECLQLPGEEVHNFILGFFWSSRMQLSSLCSPRVWPTLQQGKEITIGTDMQTARPKMVMILLNTDELMQRPPSFQCDQALQKIMFTLPGV